MYPTIPKCSKSNRKDKFSNLKNRPMIRIKTAKISLRINSPPLEKATISNNISKQTSTASRTRIKICSSSSRWSNLRIQRKTFFASLPWQTIAIGAITAVFLTTLVFSHASISTVPVCVKSTNASSNMIDSIKVNCKSSWLKTKTSWKMCYRRQVKPIWEKYSWPTWRTKSENNKKRWCLRMSWCPKSWYHNHSRLCNSNRLTTLSKM